MLEGGPRLMQTDLDTLRQQIESIPLVRPMGRVAGVQGNVVRVSGLASQARIGDKLVLHRDPGAPLTGEVLQIDRDLVRMLPDTAPDGVAIGDRVTLEPVPPFAPSPRWIGRVIDPYGRPLDNRPLPQGSAARDLMAPPPRAAERRPLGARLATGLSVFNTMLPIVEGQRIDHRRGSLPGDGSPPVSRRSTSAGKRNMSVVSATTRMKDTSSPNMRLGMNDEKANTPKATTRVTVVVTSAGIVLS